jgi:cyclopentanol dehydrogenase
MIMERLNNKTAIVTGAAGGIGKAIAVLFAREGAAVMATDINEEMLEAWVSDANKEGLKITYQQHDVTHETDWEKVISRTVLVFGKIDILVNNAGIYPGYTDCEHTSHELWDKIIATNLTGPFLGCKACIPHMRKNGGGAIINIASIAGLAGGNGTAYSASKGGLRMLGKDIAVTLAGDNIRVNTICPGGVLTPMTEKMLSQPGMDVAIKNMSPQGRIGDPAEIALGALFLASDEASYVTGTDLVIDGGAVAR